MYCSIFYLPPCFVKPSAVFSSPFTFTTESSPFATRSCARCYQTSTRRTLPAPLQATLLAALESVLTSAFTSTPTPHSKAFEPRPIGSAFAIP
jgi:hypothetical protein